MDTFPQGFFEHALVAFGMLSVSFVVACALGRWLKRGADELPEWFEPERADSDARAFAVGPAAEVSDDWGGRA